MTRTRSSAGSAERADPQGEASPKKPPAKSRGEQLAALKVPLPDLVNEIVVLSAALVDHDARRKLVSSVHPDGFYGAGHAEAWAAVCELERRGLGYDPATVRQLSGGKVDTDYLDSLIRDRPAAPPNLAHHVDVLRWDHSRVEAIRGPVSTFLEALRDPNADPERVRLLARSLAASFEGTGTLRFLRDPAALASTQMAEIRRRRGGAAVWPYGIDGFDVYADGPNQGQRRIVPGAKSGQVTMVTGVSNSGKTTLTARIGLAQETAGRKVLYGAWEQGSGMTLELLAGMNLGIPRTRLMTGELTDQEDAAVEEEMGVLGERVRFFEVPFDRKREEKRRTNARSLDVIQEYVEAWGAGGGVVILDLFARALVDTRPEEEDFALQRLQAMAQETAAHFVIVHQQRSKDIMLREDKQPTLEGLKGSSAWFEIPDTVIGVHREYLFKAVADDTLRLLVLKQRHGASALTVDCDWDPNLGRIANGRHVEGVRGGMSGGGVDEFLDAGPMNRRRSAGDARDKRRR